MSTCSRRPPRRGGGRVPGKGGFDAAADYLYGNDATFKCIYGAIHLKRTGCDCRKATKSDSGDDAVDPAPGSSPAEPLKDRKTAQERMEELRDEETRRREQGESQSGKRSARRDPFLGFGRAGDPSRRISWEESDDEEDEGKGKGKEKKKKK